MMFKQALDVDKVITQLLAGRTKTDKQVNIYIIKFSSNFGILGTEKRKRRERERDVEDIPNRRSVASVSSMEVIQILSHAH
jgi:hypothetical protein